MNYSKINVNDVEVLGSNIIASITKKEIKKDGVVIGFTNELNPDRTELGSYFVEIEKVGPKFNSKEGYDCGMVEELKGFHIYTEGFDKLYKLYNSSDIHCFLKDENMKVNEMMPADNMLLLDVTKREKEEEGIILSNEEEKEEKDPREADLQGAKILAIGDGVEGFKVGQEVFFEPWIGHIFIGYDKEDKLVDLKTINFKDIRFIRKSINK